MSNNNNKQTHTSFTTVNVGDVDLGIPEINQVTAAPQNLVQSAEASTTTPALNKLDYIVKPQEKNDSLDFLLGRAERGETRGKQPPSICKVSRILRDVSVRSFIPQLVSIGPIHRENKKLKEFEWQKERYLNDLLKRSDSTPKETILDKCLLTVNTSITKIRESYGGIIKNYSDDMLASMMVMDGCFILEFCFKHDNGNFYFPNKMEKFRIALDLMLLENQVPFVVLKGLFDCLAPCVFNEKVVTLRKVLDTVLAPYIKLFHSQLREEIQTTAADSDSTDHVLGYLHRRYQHPIHTDAEASKPVDVEQAAKSSNPKHADAEASNHSIVELDRSGVNFKPHQEDERSMTIKFQSSPFAYLPCFWSKPTLLMPTLVIEDFTELILRNFIAYEQSFLRDHYYFTSYAQAMDLLIDTKEDIAKLVDSKVLVNRLGSNQEAADMINKICKNVLVEKFCYTKQFKEMDKYYNRSWPKNIAWLRRVYFSNPWSFIALVAATIVSLATVVATIFAVLDYFR